MKRTLNVLGSRQAFRKLWLREPGDVGNVIGSNFSRDHEEKDEMSRFSIGFEPLLVESIAVLVDTNSSEYVAAAEPSRDD